MSKERNRKVSCTISWPCTRTEMMEVIVNTGLGKCELKQKGKNTKTRNLWQKLFAFLHKPQLD